jgi:hypothetical protein
MLDRHLRVPHHRALLIGNFAVQHSGSQFLRASRENQCGRKDQ